jgi:hypothetical protein
MILLKLESTYCHSVSRFHIHINDIFGYETTLSLRYATIVLKEEISFAFSV